MISAVSLANYAVNGLVEGLLIALPALALTLVMGIAGFPNAATGDYMTVSAYAAVFTQKMLAVSALLAAAGALVAGMALALLCYLLVFRPLSRRPPVVSLVTSIGIALLARSVLTFFVGHDQQMIQTPLARAWNFGGVRILPTDFAVACGALLALGAVFAMLRYTPIGRQMRAVADNPDLARASGIRAKRVMLVLWAMAGALCAVGGTLYGIKSVLIPELGWELLIAAFAAMVLGGVGSPGGAVAAGLLLGLVQELSVPLVGPSYKIVIAFGMLLLVLLLRPRGLFGTALVAR